MKIAIFVNFDECHPSLTRHRYQSIFSLETRNDKAVQGDLMPLSRNEIRNNIQRPGSLLDIFGYRNAILPEGHPVGLRRERLPLEK
jgi:hypothetical protein